MSDHYDYGYCDHCDTYHDDVKQAHKKQEPRQPTSEELDEILWEQQYAVTDTSPMADAKPADPLELPRHREETPASATEKSKAAVVRRTLWGETTTKSQLGEECYAWFVERAERNLPKCPYCKGSGTVMTPDPIGIWRGVLVSERCPNCSAFVERLIAFTMAYFHNVPPAYRHCVLRTLEPFVEAVVSADRQAEIIAMLKNNPDKGYAFFGPPKAGKTVWTYALYAEMLYRYHMNDNGSMRVPVRRTTTKRMLDQHSDYNVCRKNPEWTEVDRIVNAPDVTADKIRDVSKTGRKYRLFLDDMKGWDVSATSIGTLSEVLNTLEENEGQLVVATNLTIAEFKSKYGEALFWRISKLCTVVDLFDEAHKRYPIHHPTALDECLT
ncbi:MAG: hypothetical protein WBR26_22865 [Candidatus Acidiferrum sp.]